MSTRNQPLVRRRPVIRVFVSSTFTDLKHERDALQREVFPKLEGLCASRGFQFQAIDLRWGVSAEASLDHRTMRICLEELRRSQEISPQPNFLILLGNRYGWRPLPEMISVKQYNKLAEAATAIDTESGGKTHDILKQWYLQDENNLPPVYVLQSRIGTPCETDEAAWQGVQDALWAMINRAYDPSSLDVGRFRQPPMDERERFGQPPFPEIVRFQASATEQEIWGGALSVEKPEQHVLACFRQIRNLKSLPADASCVSNFLSVTNGRIDGQLSSWQEQLKNELTNRLETEHCIQLEGAELHETTTDNGESHWDVTLSTEFLHNLQQMCDWGERRLTDIINQQIDDYWRDPESGELPTDQRRAQPSPLRALTIERQEHERFAEERGTEQLFVGRHEELRQIQSYVSGREPFAADKPNAPLIIHGSSGCGKTAMLARVAQEVAKATTAESQPIVRFLGVTPYSSDIRSLLASLCQELRQREPRQDELPAEVRELTRELHAHFNAATAEQPLILFLDALDQLSDADNGRRLNWIPFGPPLAHVKLIVSCLSDRKADDPAGEPFAALKQRGLAEQNFINLDALSEAEAQTLVFERWFPEAQRQLNREQQRTIQDRLKSAAYRQPLYLKILFEEARLWRSYNPAPEIGENVPALLGAFLDRLALPANHGPTVECALGFIASARRGLTETEILEVLYKEREYEDSLLKKLLNAMASKHELPKALARLPIAIWSRLRFDLDFYLTEHAAPGGTVLNIYHRQVTDYLRAKFLASPLQRFQCHERLAEFFQQQDYSPANLRKVDELPWQRLEIVREARDERLATELATACDRLEQLFEDISFLEAKTEAGQVFELADEMAAVFKELTEKDRRNRIFTVLEELGRFRKIAMARMTIQCLAKIAEVDSAGVGKVVMRMVAPSRKRGLAEQANLQSARVALEVSVSTCHLDSMAEDIRRVLLTACASPDSNVRSLAIVAVFRLMHINRARGLEILQELARRSVWIGFIWPRGAEVFAGCAMGLFCERPHDEGLRQDLKQMVNGVVSRIWGLKLAVWLAPKVVANLWEAVPDDYSGLNLDEVKGFKKYASEHRELFTAVNEMIDFTEPANGTSEEFAQALGRLVRQPSVPVINLALGTAMVASISRALAGEESALEAFYDSWTSLPSEHEAWHGFMYWMRVMQIGREFTKQPKLSHIWTLRMEAVIRKCICLHKGGTHKLIHTYVLGGVMPGIVFLAHQQDNGGLRLLEELIEWACSGPEGMLLWPGLPEERQASALLMRMLEVIGVEFGMFDLLSRKTAFHGISCFVGHASKFDEFLWGRLATILARMKIWTPDEVTVFVGSIPNEHRDTLQRHMNRILPKEGVGSLLSGHRIEQLYAWMLTESPGKQNGLRWEWREFVRRLFGPTSLEAAMRYGVERLIQLVG
jgi:hypothetical protein